MRGSSRATAEEQRRRHYRVDVTLSLRMRVASARTAGQGDEIDAFDELTAAASRFRKELSGAGRTFVDGLMRTIDRLTAELAERKQPSGWCPKVVVEADLSAGGVGFAWDSFHGPGTELEVEFTVHETDGTVPFRVAGTVARAEQNDDGGFDLGISFEDVAQATQQRLVRTLLDLQRLQLRAQSRR